MKEFWKVIQMVFAVERHFTANPNSRLFLIKIAFLLHIYPKNI